MAEEELVSSFEFIGEKPSGNVLEKCSEICAKYKLNAEELVDEWSAFRITSLKNATLSLEGISLMEQKALSNRKLNHTKNVYPEKVKVQKEATPKKEKPINQTEIHDVLGSSLPEVDVLKDKRSHDSVSQEVKLPEYSQPIYAERTNSGKVVVSFGKHHNYPINDQLCTVSIQGNSNWYKPNIFTGLYTSQARIANLFENNIENIAKHILNKRHSRVSENEDCTILYGRLKPEDKNKINGKTVILETSYNFNGAKEISLNITKCQNYSIFPGQIVAVKGVNVSKNLFMVQEIHSDASADFMNIPPDFNENIHIVIAAGPFTFPDNLLYEPLQDLLKQVVQIKPNVIILIGPFIDSANQNLLSMNETFESHFENLIKNIMECLMGWKVQVVLIPSSLDAHHYPVNPTLSYVLKQNYQNLICPPNPCLLNINGLILGITSMDMLFQLTKEEVSRSPQNNDRMSRLASHLLRQRNFCPLYPIRDSSISMDYERLLNDCVMDIKPHLLILPSTLRYFIKNVDNCVVVNPERLVKNHVGGTYASIIVEPTIKPGNMVNYISCQIKNI